MFQLAKSPDDRLTGGLPVFSPQRVARSLKAPEKEPASAERPAPRATVVVDLSDAVRGVVAVGKFLFRHHQNRKIAERELDARTLEMARAFRGLVGVPDLLVHADCNRSQAQACLSRMEALGYCRYLATYESEAIYVFPAFLARAWSCEYCLSESPVPQGTDRSATCECSNCGARMAQKILA